MSENAVHSEQLEQPDLIASLSSTLSPNESSQTVEPCTVPKNPSSPASTSVIDSASNSSSTSYSMAFPPRSNADSLYGSPSSNSLRYRSPFSASSTSSLGYASDTAADEASGTANASASASASSSIAAAASTSTSSSTTSATSPTTSASNTSSSSTSAGPSTSSQAGAASAGDETRNDFDCSICFDAAHDPVVSLCGHLFCWPCLHRWIETRGERAQCPVCKAAISRERVIPVYGRNSTDRQDPRDKPQPAPTPPRPQPQRQEAPQEGGLGLGGLFGGPDLFGGPGFNLSFGIGAFPFSLFWTSFNVGPGGARNPRARGMGTELSREEQFVSRIFLVLAIIFLLWIIFF